MKALDLSNRLKHAVHEANVFVKTADGKFHKVEAVFLGAEDPALTAATTVVLGGVEYVPQMTAAALRDRDPESDFGE